VQRSHNLECNLRYLSDIAREIGGNLNLSNFERRYLRVHSPHYLVFNTINSSLTLKFRSCVARIRPSQTGVMHTPWIAHNSIVVVGNYIKISLTQLVEIYSRYIFFSTAASRF